MIRHVVIICALAMYAFVVGCALTGANANEKAKPASGSASAGVGAGTSTPIVVAEGLPYRSVTLQIQRVDWIDRYKASIDEIAALGANAVKFVVDARQENGSSSAVYLDMRRTPTPDQLSGLIRYAKSKRLHVILMPIVLLDNPRITPTKSEWRGTIAPENWKKWWDSYRDMMSHFAYIAEGTGVDVLMVGSELVSTNDQVEQWTETINKIRSIYKGSLTYSSNWDNYRSVKIWGQLDLIAMNCYWKFGTADKPQPTVEQIKGEWAKIQAEILDFQKTQNKPILFSEVGWCSMANMAFEPWDYTKTEYGLDLDLQKRLYQGFFESWYGKKELGGFSIWEWSPDGGGPNDRGYTPKDKPAEDVLREWLAKPW